MILNIRTIRHLVYEQCRHRSLFVDHTRRLNSDISLLFQIVSSVTFLFIIVIFNSQQLNHAGQFPIEIMKIPSISFSIQFFHHQFISNEDINKTISSSRQLSIVDDGPLRIHVGNIPFSWSDKHLREQFDVNYC